MKKLIAILVVFAVMTTALFAQEGSWSVGSGGEIGTIMNFVPLELRDPLNPNSEQSAVLVGQTRATRIWDWWGDSYGEVSVDYRRGPLHTQFSINVNDPLGVTFEYAGNGDPFWFHVDNRLGSILRVTGLNIYDGRFYGGFNLLEGMLQVTAAIKGQDIQMWRVSDIVGDGYAAINNQNYLMLNAKPISGLQVGFVLPNVFRYGWETISDLTGVGHNNGGNASGLAKTRLIQDGLERMTFGIQFSSGPFGVSAQYGLLGRPYFKDEAGIIKDSTFLNSGAYAGVTFDITNAIRTEFALKARFFKTDDDVDRTDLAVGAKLRYNITDPLEVSLAVRYYNDVNSTIRSFSTKIENGVLRLSPYVRFDVVPAYLRFRVSADVDFPIGDYVLGNTPVGDNYRPLNSDERVGSRRAPAMAYRIQPELWFNVKGSGATDNYWGGFTGIIVKYGIEGVVRDAEYTDWVRDNSSNAEYALRHINDPSSNMLSVSFKWSF